jgi:signal transduction histidine kinase
VTVSTRTLAISPVQLQANRFALVSRLADDLAHEVKNPLHAIVINLELVRRRIGSGAPDAALDRVHVVEEEVRRIHHIVEALFQLIRPERNGEPVELGLVLGELLPLLELRARLARVDLGYTPLDGEHVVAMTRTEVKQIVLNLTEAALAATPAEGAIRISAEPGPLAVELRIAHDGAAQIPVAGPDGTPPIGPGVARSLAESRGGRLLEEPSGTGGTVFLVALPLAGGA